ncbi:MAG: antA/AntB antirepressor family protein [Burkholderiales bacterium]|nr:antA/AntB antirepressor family protein [Burkholderiales bacterium]
MSNKFRLAPARIVINNQTTYGNLNNLYIIDLEKALICAKHFLNDMQIECSLEYLNDKYNFDIEITNIIDYADNYSDGTLKPFIKPSDVLKLITLSENTSYVHETRDLILKSVIPFIHKYRLKDNVRVQTGDVLEQCIDQSTVIVVKQATTPQHDDSKNETTIPTEKQLINIQPQRIGNEIVNAVSARELWKFLEVKKDFSDWMKQQISSLQLIENVDYIRSPQKGELSKTKQNTIEYYVTLDIAKHISMASRCSRGREVRDYFIECERKAHNLQIIPPTETVKIDRPNVNKQLNASFLKAAVKQIDGMIISDESKQVLKAHLLHEQAGLPLDMMLPIVNDSKLSPTQIAERLKISSRAVGHLITKLGLRGNQNYCEARLSKAMNGSRDVVMYYYNTQAVNMIEQFYKEKINAKAN